MPAVNETIQVEGLRDLQRAFRVADDALNRELRDRLKDLAAPVATDAERLAVSGIPRIGLPWSRMRIGVTARSVYVAPRQRGSRGGRGRRPNLAGLLLGRSMVPALDRNTPKIVEGFDDILKTVGKKWEQA